MAEIILSTGRGGTGKSTFATLAARHLSPPMLLIDLDPDESLADMLGFDLAQKGISTISDKLYDILEAGKSGQEDPAVALEKIGSLIETECLYKGDNEIDLIVLGTKLTKGCYCMPDDLLKGVMPIFIDRYANVVIDSPAGLEHLNRKVVSDLDDIFVILDPSSKSLQHIGRIRDLTEELKIKYKNFYLVANYGFDTEQQTYFEDSGQNFLGKIAFDPDVAAYNLSGQSLLKLPESSPASLSVKNILTIANLSR